jgi:hypothetical protein
MHEPARARPLSAYRGAGLNPQARGRRFGVVPDFPWESLMQRILAPLAAGLLTAAIVAGTAGSASADRLENEPVVPHAAQR